jgi:hypothetical protein
MIIGDCGIAAIALPNACLARRVYVLATSNAYIRLPRLRLRVNQRGIAATKCQLHSLLLCGLRAFA